MSPVPLLCLLPHHPRSQRDPLPRHPDHTDPRAVRVAHEIGQSVMLDNGAFSVWRRGLVPDWDAYMDWAEPWLEHPTTWAAIPDVIDGSEEDNDRLLVHWYARRMPKGGAPVWHLHESLDRLRYLSIGYERVCFGSSGQYAVVGTDKWHRRVSEAFDAIADDGRVPWIHMLRGMALSGSHYPFASVDSTDVAQNHNRESNTALAMADRWDGKQCPARWHHTGVQLGIPCPDFDMHLDYPERFNETGVI